MDNYSKEKKKKTNSKKKRGEGELKIQLSAVKNGVYLEEDILPEPKLVEEVLTAESLIFNSPSPLFFFEFVFFFFFFFLK